MPFSLNLGGFSLPLEDSAGGTSSGAWNYQGNYDNGISYNTDDVVFYNGGLWYCYTSANLSAGYPPDSRPECWVQVSVVPFGSGLWGQGNYLGNNLAVTYADLAIDLNGGLDYRISALGYIKENPFNQSLNTNDSPSFEDVHLDGTLFLPYGNVNFGNYRGAQFGDTGCYITSYEGPFIDFHLEVPLGLGSNFQTWIYPDGSASFANGAATIDGNGAIWSANNIWGLNLLSNGGLSVQYDANFANGTAGIDGYGQIYCSNPVSSSTDSTVDSKVEIMINGTAYYLLASTSAS